MKAEHLVVLVLLVVAGVCLLRKGGYLRENMSGYGTISGLAMNNGAKYCFKNIYDPEFDENGVPFGGYCSVVGKVVV